MLLGARDETTMLPGETPQSTINLGALVHLPSWQHGLRQLQGPSSFWFPFLRKVGARQACRKQALIHTAAMQAGRYGQHLLEAVWEFWEATPLSASRICPAGFQ